jgi:glycosyltransferase involved in cell wall biosynthesis
MTIRRVALIFDDRLRPDTTGVYVRRALAGLVEVVHFHPDQRDLIPARGFDLYMTVFARIALELGRRRPEISLLVVEGRGRSDRLAGVALDLSGLTNLHRMAHTPDPRDFYRVSLAALMPSLWRESLGRVAIEAMANGIPVLAGDRGALPETLGAAGFVFTIPARCTPAGPAVPTPREVAPWVAVLERLWDDPEFEARHRARSQEAGRWETQQVVDRYEALFQALVDHRRPVRLPSHAPSRKNGRAARM